MFFYLKFRLIFLVFLFIYMPALFQSSCFAQKREAGGFIDVPSAILMELKTGKVLYAKAPYEKIVPASLTKLMTILLTYEYISKRNAPLSTCVSISRNASKVGGKSIYLKENERISVEDLIKSTLIFSANDAACALGEFVAGSEDKFVEIMNKRALELGMKNTHFYNANGFPKLYTRDTQYSCAFDIAVLSRYLILNYPQVLEYSKLKNSVIRNGAFNLVNTNKLLYSRPDVIGLKTAYVKASGYCVANLADRDGFSLLSVVLGVQKDTVQFNISSRLIDYGFDNFKFVKIASLPEPKSINVKNGEKSVVPIGISAPVFYVAGKQEDSKEGIKYDLPLFCDAPVSFNQKVGTAHFFVEDNHIASVPLVVLEAVNRKKTVMDKVKQFFQ